MPERHYLWLGCELSMAVNRTHVAATMHLTWITVSVEPEGPFVAGAFMTMKAAEEHADKLNEAEPGDTKPFEARYIGTLYTDDHQEV